MNTNELGFFLFLAGLALTQALPTKLTDEKFLNEGQEDLKIDETGGEDQVRPKKSTICLETGNLVPQVQSSGIQTISQPVQTLNIQPVPQRLQTFNVQAVPQQQQVQAVSIQQIPPQIQMNVVQPSQACMKLIQPPVQPTVKVIQPPQVYLPSQTNVNIIQPPREEKPVVKPVVIKEKVVKSDPKPEKIVLPKEEPLFALPPKPIMVVAEPEPVACVKVPQCNQCQQSVMQCSCTKQQIPSLSSVVLMEPAAKILEFNRRNSQAVPLLNHHAHHHHHHRRAPLHIIPENFHEFVHIYFLFVLIIKLRVSPMPIQFSVFSSFNILAFSAITVFASTKTAKFAQIRLTLDSFFLQKEYKNFLLFGVRETKRLATDAYNKIHVDRGPVTAVELLTINMRQPEAPYYRSAIPGMVEETFPREGDFGLIRASRGEELEEEEVEVHSADQIAETDDGKVGQGLVEKYPVKNHCKGYYLHFDNISSCAHFYVSKYSTNIQSAIAQYQTTPLLFEVCPTPPHESRDPNQPIANFRCVSVASEEARFSGLPSQTRSYSDRFEGEIPLLEIRSTTAVRAILEHSWHSVARLVDSVLDFLHSIKLDYLKIEQRKT
ncbi:hypothetical protein WN51_14482 [Melipona quadrifasciata]|uniref:Uncharacterized protein n=1 Tax=Melipona quadrifasciata TaxID=166423 RepID=A0A0M8ZZT2_9HYME|nr:hypothetical protein WN51_14482 [Melipona quadrifasciata]